jgi:hypothetical protein
MKEKEMEEQAIELPELPKPAATLHSPDDDLPMFAPVQMQRYARAAVLQERERCARLADEMDFGMGQLAAAIRNPSPPPKDSHNGCG